MELIREALEEERKGILNIGGESAPRLSREEIKERVAGRVAGFERLLLQRVINATGVVLHTNLGRAPLGKLPWAASEACDGYLNLEFDLVQGARGERGRGILTLLRVALGAPAALIVNNNAAAILLTLSALVRGREVIISRGELVEIGDSFRIPEILALGETRIKEIGTTNRTHLSDYETGIGPDTAAILRVHRSNFKMVGFVASPEVSELSALARRRGILMVVDLGSGALLDTGSLGLQKEPTVREILDAGADVVSLSGDKLLGGPQAGIIAGREELVMQCRRHSLYRALRVGKLTLWVLQQVLLSYLGDNPVAGNPTWQMMALPEARIKRRAGALARQLTRILGEEKVEVATVHGDSAVGGGALPCETIPTWLLTLRPGKSGPSVMELSAGLRSWSPPIVTRSEDGRLVFDLRTVDPRDDRAVLAALVFQFKKG